MTGGSVGNQRGGHENNTQGSVVKQFPFPASRRRSTTTLQLSMLGSGGTRSDEHIPLTSHCETAFVEHVTPRSCFLSNSMDHSGRLRTSSLTMEVSVRNRKEIDSGNSSLIDSSSADSYQDFGSGCRSPTTSSSKSEQSLTSVNNNEFQIDNNRQRHSSVSDSLGGSSGKMSINTSDITESSEDSLTQDKNKDDVTHSLPFYVQEDGYSDSECQPFLFLPGHRSLQTSRDDIKNGNSYRTQVCKSESYGDENRNFSSGDIFNATSVNVDLVQVAHESLKRKAHRRMKDKEINTYLKHTARERKPLLQDHECTTEGIAIDDSSFNDRFSCALRRCASLGNISDVPHDSLEIPVNGGASQSPLLVGNSHTKAAAYGVVTRQLQSDCTSELQPLTLLDHHLQVCGPYSSQGSGLPSSYVLTNVSHPYLPQQQPQHHQADSHSRLCSNYDHPCMTHLMFNNEYGSPHVSETTSTTSTAYTTQPLSHINMQGSCCSDSSKAATRSPVQNLESVLGYGTPVSLSVLKQGLKPLKSEHSKPLEVLVPKIKVSVQEGNHIDLPENLTSNTLICQVNNNPNNACIKADYVPLMESTREPQTQLNDAQDATNSSLSNKQTPPRENQLYIEADFGCESYMHPPAGMRNNQNIILCERIPKEHFRCCFNNQTIIPSYNMPLSSGDQSELRIQDGLNCSLPRRCCNTDFLPSNVNQQRLLDSNHNRNVGTVRQPTLSDGGWLSEPIFSHNSHAVGEVQKVKSNKDIELKTNALSMPHHFLHSWKNCQNQEQNAFHSADYHVVKMLSSTPEHTTKLKTNVFISGNEVRSNHCTQNEQDHQCLQYLPRPDQLHTTNIPRSESDLSQTQVDDNGYQAGMTLSVPKACFVPGFLEAHDHLIASRTSDVINCVPSTIDGVSPVNINRSLPCSNPSQLGLLKANLDSKRQTDIFIREIPDYKYLCFVAIILNPVLGLVALACNHCAQKDLRKHRRRRANNFYFATITVSTVAIFFTLIGGALLLAHSVILNGEKHQVTPPLRDKSCEDQFFGHDDSLQTFFGIDFALYCEITKNEKIMQALKRFWLEDAHNKAIHNKQRANNVLAKDVDGRNATAAGSNGMQNEDSDIFGAADLNDTSSHVAKKASEERLPSEYDLIKSNLPKQMKQLSTNGTTNISLTKSNENPIIPAGMQREYERYLSGEKRTKVISDGQSSVLGDVLSKGDQFSSPPSVRSSWTTTVSNILSVNATEASVDGVVEMEESSDKANTTWAN